MTREFKTPAQALTAALVLAATAPTAAASADCAGMAETIAAGMDSVDVQNVRDVVEICLSMLNPEAEQ
jgi:hypothetical protein|tara:strand:+ start:277 stop:480 length:204 start_codon:yes stop_codon:yes gene_type:complete